MEVWNSPPPTAWAPEPGRNLLLSLYLFTLFSLYSVAPPLKVVNQYWNQGQAHPIGYEGLDPQLVTLSRESLAVIVESVTVSTSVTLRVSIQRRGNPVKEQDKIMLYQCI